MLKILIKFSIFYLCGTLLYPCTTILVGKGLTKDGSIIHAHNEDMGNLTVGRLWRGNKFFIKKETKKGAYFFFLKKKKKKYYFGLGG